jgi:hypothetical protein
MGVPALVIGGGPSAPQQFAEAMYDLPNGTIRLSANQHGCLLTRCDYIVAVDGHINAERFKRQDGSEYGIRDFGVPIIAPKAWADYRIFNQVLPSSGVMAAWLAWIMGCAPIVLAGIDLYDGGTYFHDVKAESTGHRLAADQHLERWAKLKLIAEGAAFRAMGGRLLELFPRFRRGERVEFSVPDSAKLRTAVSGVEVEFKFDWEASKSEAFKAGMIVELTSAEARLAVASKAARMLA